MKVYNPSTNKFDAVMEDNSITLLYDKLMAQKVPFKLINGKIYIDEKDEDVAKTLV